MLEMDTHTSLKKDILQINKDLSKQLSDAGTITGVSDNSFADWRKTCNDIGRQLSEEMIRIAVVGPIKSGKSTFINAFFKGDYLKRGAGVLTSIVTRTRSGKKLKARLFFKSWDEINSEIEQALILFPSLDWRTETDRFDIRNMRERKELQKALDALGSAYLISNGARDVNSILLSSYLKGYQKVQDVISSEPAIRQYEDKQFSEHWGFVSDGALSVYLKDIQLEIISGDIDNNIEIADCQGSDSLNPLHLAMIQDYLFQTNLIIYVISSRTGLREADIKFLSIIKKMGIMDNILFVINFDFNEHESILELNVLIEKIKDEISLIRPDPEVYSMSALFNLFKAQELNLPEKDSLRLAQWEKEREFAAFSDSGTERFNLSLHNKVIRRSVSLLLKNHLERLNIISSGISHWIILNQNILTRDGDGANDIIKNIKSHQNRMRQVKSVIKNTLDGSTQQIKREIKVDMDRYFDSRSGVLINDIIEFIRSYQASYQPYEENLKASGFSNTLYLIYQEFKRALDIYMGETINPEVIHFIREKEMRIREHLESITEPFDVMVADAVDGYNRMMEGFGIGRLEKTTKRVELPDVDAIKAISGLTLPPAVAHMRYSAKIKTEAVMRLGFYTMVKFFKKALKKPIQNKNEEEILALKDGVLRMKRETEKSIIFHFKDYQENVKFQYIDKLIDAVSDRLYESLLDRFQIYASDLSDLIDRINSKIINREQVSEFLKKMGMTSNTIGEHIHRVREKIEANESAGV